MSAEIIDGKKLAQIVKDSCAQKVQKLKDKAIIPGLAVILVGNDPASEVYVGHKVKACKEVGIKSFEIRLNENASFEDVKAKIEEFNNNPEVHGILLQLPLPPHLNSDELIQCIAPTKDVDGLTIDNVGRLTSGLDGLVPCTPQGSLKLIKTIKNDLNGLHAVIIGRSLLFGKPMAQLLLQENCTITQCHSHTQNIEDITRQADILIAATGRPLMVKENWIKEGAIVIDVGINRTDDNKLVGDVDYDNVKNIASAITPVPGGVGPMTIACLLENTLKASELA